MKEAKALSNLLKLHPNFQEYKIINIAGNGDDEEENKNALDLVQKGIGKKPEQTKTITLTCGKLTTGVTIPAWTAVLMLYGSSNTSAISYLQTIFRVQNPTIISGKTKEKCYVFDFAPTRVLNVIHEAFSSDRNNTYNKNLKIQEFLNFCPVINYNGSKMIKYNSENLIKEVKNIIVERVVKNGFYSMELFDKNSFSFNDEELEKFKYLKKIIKSNQNLNKNNIEINDQKISDGTNVLNNFLEKKENNNKNNEIRNKNKEKKDAIDILRNIAIRIPLFIYSFDFEKIDNISIDNFTQLCDDESWKEFMPPKVTKKVFNQFIEYFKNDIFQLSAKKIYNKLVEIDKLDVIKRIFELIKIFSTFKNPDKETVLTPWLVINQHLGKILGGYVFYEENNQENLIEFTKQLNFYFEKGYKDEMFLNEKIFNLDSKILDINAKSGLYLLWVAFNIFYIQKKANPNLNEKKLWNRIIQNNIFVICRTKMTASIVNRTLIGFDKNVKANILVKENIVEEMKNQYKNNYKELFNEIKSNFNLKENINENFIFDAVVGNPPYQSISRQQIYTDFYLLSIKIGKIVSLIFPTGWQEPKNSNNLEKMNNDRIKKDKQIVFINNKENVFKGIKGAQWVNFILWIKNYDNNLKGKQLIIFSKDKKEIKLLPIKKSDILKQKEIEELSSIVINSVGFISIQNKIKNQNNYNILTNAFEIDELNNTNKFSDNASIQNNIKVYGIYKRTKKIKYTNKINFKIDNTFFNKYKVFVPEAWGNFSEKYLGGAYSNIIIAKPKEIATKTFLEHFDFDNLDKAKKYAKYLMTRFLRALLFKNKHSHHTRTAWEAIPYQNFEETWWDKTINEIDEHLMKKYNIPENIREFIYKNIQPKNETNIDNFIFEK
ncbi:Eco57I restriction-modification methylase domain-containing protein [[Mycoplasma] collis]|uniref:Eco57I restriction-modification methylase domain-containing protein n=1 Tax=[Mycoplasma] collis TaxID=2127 RepID=UPI00068D26BC|nr:Eco57I restriction-modification methylase domain-containing protein [[Mycoplasma] collis]